MAKTVAATTSMMTAAAGEKKTVAIVKSKVNKMIATVSSLNTNKEDLSRARQRVLVT